MSGLLVDDSETPLTEIGLCAAVLGGYQRVLGVESRPTAGTLAGITSQAALETARGQKIHGNNPGNRKKPAGWEGKFARYKCDEIFDPATAARAVKLSPGNAFCAPWKGGPNQRVVLVPPHPWSEFVFFDTSDEGFADWLELLACLDRYRAAWHLFMAGDVAGAGRALGAAHYYTADIETYVRGMVSLSKTLLPLCESTLAGRAHDLSDQFIADVEGLVALHLADITFHRNVPAAIAA